MKDVNKTSRESPRTSPGDEAAPREPREHASGRVAFDSRGDAVWEWRADDGQFKADASTTRVQKLLPRELAIEQTQRVPVQPAPKEAAKALPGGGYDPYDRVSRNSPKPVAPARPAVPRVRYPPVVAPPPEEGLLARLGRWLGVRRR
jgi:hypothetical protein